MKILFRTAGGKAPKVELGLGHIFRSINLAKEFEKNKVFFLIEDYGGVKKILKDNQFNRIFLLNHGITIEDDLKKTTSVIKKNKIDVLVIDHYHLKKKYVQRMRRIVKVIVISDLGKIQFPADLLINGFIGFENQITKNKYGTKCLLGPQYQILNKNFSKKLNCPKKKFKILASFGGYDEQNISEVILEELINLKISFYAKIILGPVADKTLNFKKLLKIKPKNIKIQTKTYDMRKEMVTSEFGFCSGGITTYEFASLNIPFAIICDDKHQLKTAREWQKRKIAINLGIINIKTKNDIRKIILKLIDNKINFQFGRKMIDGEGSIRVVNEILKIIEKN